MVVGDARVVSGGEKKNHLIELAPFGRLHQMLRTTKRCPPKKHLIEAAPFGRLDEMLRTIVLGRGLWGLCPPRQTTGGSGGQRPLAKTANFCFFSKFFGKFCKVFNKNSQKIHFYPSS